MKRQRFLAVLLSAVIAFTPAVQVMAEKNVTQEQTVESGQDESVEDTSATETDNANAPQNDSTGEENKEDIQADNNNSNINNETQSGMTGGYIPSKLDYNTPVYYGGNNRSARAASNVPAKYPAGGVEEIKASYPASRNQNPYGTCWAFSSMGLAEFDLINKGLYNANTIDLSELQLAYFTFNFVKDPLGGTEGDFAHYYNENTTTKYLNYGGNYEMAARRLGQWIGAANESTVPYSKAYDTIDNGLSDDYAYNYDEAHLENTYMINIKQNAADVKQQIMEHGAVGVMYYHSDSALDWNWQNDINTYYDTDKSGGGHAVMVVGWDDDFSVDNFKQASKPANKGAWLIRNSWGTYCDYFWMSYDTVSLTDTAWVFDMESTDDYDNNYQLDGGLESFRYGGSNTVANVFTVQSKENIDSENLKAVSLSFTQKANVNYSIDIYTNLKDKSNPLSGTKQEAATTTGTSKYAGIYTVPLVNEVKLTPGTNFSVVVTMDEAAMDCEEATSISSDSSSDETKYIWSRGVSFYDGNKYKSFLKDGNGTFTPYYRNFRIKAFTSNNKEYSITYNLDGGTNASENPSSYTTGNTAIKLKDPVKEGYTFEGWFTDSTYTNQITEIPANSTENFTLYAKWQKDSIGEEVTGYSLSLNGTIDVNFYTTLDENLINNPDAYMEFTLPNGTVEQQKVSEATQKDGKYVFSCGVAAKEMTAEVKAQMKTPTESGKVHTYSVRDYADQILNGPVQYDDTVKNLVKKMLNYGAAAQEYFGYKTDDLANAQLDNNDKNIVVDNSVFNDYKHTLTNSSSVTGIEYYGSSLTLESETSINHYFKLDDNANINDYVFECVAEDGTKSGCTPQKSNILKDNYYWIKTRNMRAYNLNQPVAITVRMKNQDQSSSNAMKLEYSTFSYGYNLLKMENPEASLVNVMNAMYKYWQMAKEYAEQQK